MNKLMTRKTISKTLLAASLMLLATLSARGADQTAVRTAVRPEALSADAFGNYGGSNYNTPTGTYGVPGSLPYGNATCPTCPNGTYCPTCPNPQQPTMPTGYGYPAYYDTTAGNYGGNTGDVLPPDDRLSNPTGLPAQGYNRPGRFQNFFLPENTLPGSGYPTNVFPNGAYPNGSYPNATCPSGNCPSGTCPTGNCPNPLNSNFPGSTYPNSTYPGPTYPSNTYPGPNYLPNNSWPTVPNSTNYSPNGWPVSPNTGIPSVPRSVDDATTIDNKITSRYQNAEMLALLNRLNVTQATNLYVEASRLIDTRHVAPASYEDRTRRALETLAYAVRNPAFLRASNANPDPRQVETLQRELQQLAQSTPARTANEAIGVMQWAANLAQQRLGVRQEAVALEFFNGTLDSLDKYSAFVPSKSAYGMLEDGLELKSAALEENIVGVGVELKTHDQGALVLGTVPNGPAARARLAAGDLLVGIDGRDLRGMSLSQIASLISGPAGSPVTFRILRNGQSYTASMRREQVYVSSVANAQMLDQTTGYIRLKQFSESSAEDLEKAMWTLYNGGMKSLVLDLRGNPGGLLTEAVQVSNLFVPSGRIVATKGRTASDDSDERATFDKTWRLPLVVLVDENSASASEIFAAAIQENGRGLIVGRNTYGKGTVQTHFPLQSVSGNLKLTTAKFYSPRGRQMEGAGVHPDVAVNAPTGDMLASNLSSDQDVRTALDVMARGIPANLAASSGQNRPGYDLTQIGN